MCSIMAAYSSLWIFSNSKMKNSIARITFSMSFKTSKSLKRKIVIPNSNINVAIQTGVFANTPNLTEIELPDNVIAIAAGAFPSNTAKNMVINVERLENNIPIGWEAGWYASSSGAYVVEIVWGYNG